MSNLVSKNLQAWRARVEELVKDLHDLTRHTGNEALAQTVSDLRNRIHEPFMFVIVGEVKAGKSSFINALLATGREITKVAPQPMTDIILQILYGDTEEEITINPYLKKILLPVDILREIAIVDTPGTNTIIEHHQEITERFIPASDLIVFVFEAKNPYRQSAWDFFNFINEEWHKKIIFVLQQKDLMNAEDLAVNLKGVSEYAIKKGIAAPVVFAVSAKAEQEGRHEESGFAPLQQYIRQHITGGQAPLLKLQNNVALSQNIAGRIGQALDIRQAQLTADTEFRQDIRQTLDHQERRSYQQVDLLVENLVAAYERITRDKEAELNAGLGFFSLLRRSFSSIFSKKTSLKEWLDQLARNLEGDLHRELRNRLDLGVSDLADSVQQMAKLIELKIRDNPTILKSDHDIFGDIVERRGRVILELQEAFSKFMNQTDSFTDNRLFPDKSSVSPNIATGSGLAVIGLILAAVTQGMVFDVTGGVLTTIGVLFAGVTSSIKRRKILAGFRQEIAKGQTRLEQEVSDKLKTYIEQLKLRIDSNFKGFDTMLEREQEQIKTLSEQHRSLNVRLEALAKEL
ncbi:MAG TPA: dynamin family protein [Saprospiraceae bacterium]|nr:dynamin family protein [Saprospiraceae bacterium]HMP22797.1 dynamin family protein [Saprospiraceae bacterium]